MKSNKKGQILIEAVVGMAIFTILATALFSGYNAYLKTKKYNKVNATAIEYVDAVIKELKCNMTYEEVKKYSFQKTYYLNDISIDSLMNTSIISLISEKQSNTKESFTLNFTESKNKEEIVIKVQYKYNGELNYNYEKEVSKVKYTQ